MIVRLTGQLIEVHEDSIVIERSGLAREVLIPRYSTGELAAHRGQEITVHTMEFLEGNPASGHLVPRMLGFMHMEDKIFFTRFVNVKGIGPRKALKALAQPVRKIATWIETSDAKALTTLPGIGARAADLMVASLKGKMGDLALPDMDSQQTEAAILSQAQRDALEILVAWGDPRSDAHRWIERAGQLHPDLKLPDEWVRTAYRIKAGVEG